MHETTSSPDLVDDALVANLVRAAMFAALMGAFAYVSFPNPLSPGVPVTLQVLGVFLAGILLGPVWGSIAIVIYLVAGGLGAPVFSMGAAGTGVLFGETIGYLFGFPVAAAAVGLVVHGGLDVSDHRRSVPRLIGAMVVGVAIIYVLGVAGLMIRLELGPIQAIVVGAAAFVPADAIKIAAAIGIVRSDRLAAL